MWFNNLTLFRFTQPFGMDAAELEQLLAQRPFRHCGSLELANAGWAVPLGKHGDTLVHGTNGCLMLCLEREEKILPASVISEFVAVGVEAIEADQDRAVRRKERDDIRDEVLHRLLPRAFTHTRRTYGYIDPKGGWLIVDSASAGKADEFVSILRQCLGSLPVVPLTVQDRPGAVMTHWFGDDWAPPEDVALESECELRSPDDGGIVRCRKHDLAAPEIHHHLEAGKEVVKLAFTWRDRLSLVLDETLAIKRLRFLDLVQEEAAAVETDDPAVRFDADFAIMSGELAEFLPALVGWFGGLQEAAK